MARTIYVETCRGSSRVYGGMAWIQRGRGAVVVGLNISPKLDHFLLTFMTLSAITTVICERLIPCQTTISGIYRGILVSHPNDAVYQCPSVNTNTNT